MGLNSYPMNERRYQMMQYIIRVGTTSYQSLREQFDVADSTIARDLAYIQDYYGLLLITKSGVGGYVMVDPIWYQRLPVLSAEEEDYLIEIFYNESDKEHRKIMLQILYKTSNPYKFSKLLDFD